MHTTHSKEYVILVICNTIKGGGGGGGGGGVVCTLGRRAGIYSKFKKFKAEISGICSYAKITSQK